jgi:hypothetical protein
MNTRERERKRKDIIIKKQKIYICKCTTYIFEATRMFGTSSLKIYSLFVSPLSPSAAPGTTFEQAFVAAATQVIVLR